MIQSERIRICNTAYRNCLTRLRWAVREIFGDEPLLYNYMLLLGELYFLQRYCTKVPFVCNWNNPLVNVPLLLVTLWQMCYREYDGIGNPLANVLQGV